MHNRPDIDGKRPMTIGEPRAFRNSPVADLFVADERATNISEVPIEPHVAMKPGWEYPIRSLPEEKTWKMRRFAMLVKHDPQKSKIPDYMVIRDEIISPELIGWNLHVLGREIEGGGPSFHFPGQLGVDLDAHFLNALSGKIQKSEWGWSGPASERREAKGADYEKRYFGKMIPDNFQRGSWKEEDGERTKWLRISGPAGASAWFVVLMPGLKGQSGPKVEKISETAAGITLGTETETIHLGTDAKFQAAVERNNQVTTLLASGALQPLDKTQFKASPPARKKWF